MCTEFRIKFVSAEHEPDVLVRVNGGDKMAVLVAEVGLIYPTCSKSRSLARGRTVACKHGLHTPMIVTR